MTEAEYAVAEQEFYEQFGRLLDQYCPNITDVGPQEQLEPLLFKRLLSIGALNDFDDYAAEHVWESAKRAMRRALSERYAAAKKGGSTR